MKIKELFNKHWFIGVFLAVVFSSIFGAGLYENIKRTKAQELPKCLDVIGDFYKDASKSGSALSAPLSNDLGTLFRVIGKDSNVHALCMYFPWIDITKTACGQYGDSHKKCAHTESIISHYGYGVAPAQQPSQPKPEIKPSGPSF